MKMPEALSGKIPSLLPWEGPREIDSTSAATLKRMISECSPRGCCPASPKSISRCGRNAVSKSPKAGSGRLTESACPFALTVGSLRKARALRSALGAMIKRFLPSSASMAGQEQLKELQRAASIEKLNERLNKITMMMVDINDAEKMSRRMSGVDLHARAALSARLSNCACAIALQPPTRRRRIRLSRARIEKAAAEAAHSSEPPSPIPSLLRPRVEDRIKRLAKSGGNFPGEA